MLNLMAMDSNQDFALNDKQMILIERGGEGSAAALPPPTPPHPKPSINDCHSERLPDCLPDFVIQAGVIQAGSEESLVRRRQPKRSRVQRS
jgi:hypothetical protein